MNSTPFCIGILGGMGPEAGVLLQDLIIKSTPATKDQDHIAVITYTNPHIPDRTQSLAEDGGRAYLQAVIDSLRLLEAGGVSILVMACNTAHARLPEIQQAIKTPILSIVQLARDQIELSPGAVGILATDGTIRNGLFSIPEKTLSPEPEIQILVMRAIRDIKRGLKDDSVIERLCAAVLSLERSGCSRHVLGCTELSICHDELIARFGSIFIDPLRLAAHRLVEMARAQTWRSAPLQARHVH